MEDLLLQTLEDVREGQRNVVERLDRLEHSLRNKVTAVEVNAAVERVRREELEKKVDAVNGRVDKVYHHATSLAAAIGAMIGLIFQAVRFWRK